MRLPAALRAFLAVSIVSTLLCAGTVLICRYLLHWQMLYDTPLLQGWVLFPDFRYFLTKFAYFHSPAFYTHSYVLPYPAPALVGMKLFMIPQPQAGHGGWATARFEGSLLVLCCVVAIASRKLLVRQGVERRSATWFAATTFVCAFPVWFDFVQGNIEWVVCSVLMLGIWAFCTGRLKLAAVCIGVAGAMKVFPIIFIGLFLPVKRYREVFWTILSAAAATLVGLWLVCPDIRYSFVQTAGALGGFGHQYMAQVRAGEIGFDHSLFAITKLGLRSLTLGGHYLRGLGFYLPFVALVGCLTFFLRICKLPLINQVLCLTVAAILLPPVSYEYTLMYLYGTLALLLIHALQSQREGTHQHPPGLWVAFVLLAFLLSPQSEFIEHGHRFEGQLKCMALLALGYVGLRYPFALKAGSLGGGLPRRGDGNRAAEGGTYAQVGSR